MNAKGADERGCVSAQSNLEAYHRLRVHGSNQLGHGFLEKVYENAPAHELRKAGLAVEQQRGITITYDGITVGEYVVDLLVEDAVLIELETVRSSKMRTARDTPTLRVHLRLFALLSFPVTAPRPVRVTPRSRPPSTRIPPTPHRYAART